MTKNKFFEIQSELTATKIRFFERYIERYLIKVLMKFGRCFIGDLFCGAGKNGEEDGSPLILIDKAKSILENDLLLKRHSKPEVIILFNDRNEKNIKSLKEELKEIDIPDNIKIIEPTCKDFADVLAETKSIFKKIKQAKFFFLDPYGYSDIHIDDIKTIMDFSYTEILLFLPTFFIYRFADAKKKIEGETKRFLDEFTTKGPGRYHDIDDFNESIRQRLLQYMELEFVRTMRIEGGTSKNALFFLTKHVLGIINMNELFWKFSEDGKGVIATRAKNKEKNLTLFELDYHTKPYKIFIKQLEETLQRDKKMLNIEIIRFAAREGVRLTHATNILKELQKGGKIKVSYLVEGKSRGFFISEQYWNKKMCEIEYIRD